MPKDTSRAAAKSPKSLSGLIPFLQPYRGRIALAVVFLVMAATSTLLLPVALKSLIDQGLVAADPGERVMALLKRLYAKLHLRVNESKSAVASAYDRKFLGYSFWAAKGKAVKLRVADKAQKAYKQRVRQLTRRIGGKGMVEVALKLKQYVNGWKAYFKLADTPRVWRELDEWMRHRLRAMQLKQWKQGRTMYRELTKLGAPQGVAERVAANSRCWWRNSDGLIKTVLTIQYFDKLGAPRLV